MSDGTRRKRDRLMARLRHLWKSWKARKHKASRGRIEKRTGNPQTNVSTAIPSNASVLTHMHRKDTPSAHPVTTIEPSSGIQAEGTIYNEGVQSDSIISSQQTPVTATEHKADTLVQEQGKRTDDSTAASIIGSQSLWSRAFYHADLNDERTKLKGIGIQADARDSVTEARSFVANTLKNSKTKAWKIDKLLNWMDKFKEIGDIVVQYDPAHAALPWAAFRLLLNICVARHTTLEAIVDGLEYIASLIQRCTLYEIIYEKENFNASANLRESILQLYIAVLKFFAKAIDKVKENHVKAVFTTENISDYLGNVRKLEKTVKDDADLVAAQATRDDFKRLRAQLKNMNHMTYRIQDWIADRDRSSTLRWISTIPYISHHKRISEGRLDGTGEWLFERQEYKDWMSSSESKLLLLRGIPGAGKTYMASKVIDFLHEDMTGPKFAYFYCNRAEEDRREPDRILNTIVQQLAQCGFNEKELPKPVVDVYQDRRSKGQDSSPLSLKESERLLVQLTDMYPETIICIDALDEVAENGRMSLLKALNAVIAKSKSLVKIFATTRQDPDIVAQFKMFPRIELEPEDNVGDINHFVKTRVQSAIHDSELLGGDVSDELRSEICEVLCVRSKGMFQLAALQITFLCQLFTEDDVRRRLPTIPDTLKDAYNDIYCSITSQNESAPVIALNAFRWIKYSYEPLRSETLLDAISVEVGKSREFSRTTPIHANMLLKICRNLLILDERLNVFRFAHLSVEEFLETRPELNKSNSHAVIAPVCFSLLCTPGSWEGYAAVVIREGDYQDRNLLSYSVVFWPWHFSHCTDEIGHHALTALWNAFIAESNYQKWRDYHLRWVETIGDSQQVGFWRRVWHWQIGSHDRISLVCMFELTRTLITVLESTCGDKKVDLSRILGVPSDLADLNITSLLIDNGADVRTSDGRELTPLHIASKQEHEEAMVFHNRDDSKDLRVQLKKMNQTMSDIGYWLEDSERFSILQWISAIPYSSHHRRISEGRLEGTGEWLFDRPQYNEWMSSSESKLLLLRGIPGAGKTYIASKVIDCLQPDTTGTNFAYFYCNRAEESRREPGSILNTIIQQLAQCDFDEEKLAKPVVDVYRDRKIKGQTSSPLSLIESQKLLVQLTDMYPETIICIDALDEVAEDKRIHLLKALNAVIATSESLVKIFATTRMDPDIVAQFEMFPRIELKPDDNVSDINQFVKARVQSAIDDGELLSGKVSDELRSQICRVLSQRSIGMFQLAALQITSLCQMCTQYDVRHSLQTLPDTLKDVYNDIYRNIAAQRGYAPRLALMAFRWVKYSYEPLQKETLLDAISVEVRRSGEFSRTAPIHANMLLKICQNLLILDERRNVFRFAHPAVEEFLETQPELNKADSHAEIAEVCLSLLCAPGSWNGYAKMDIEEKDYNRNRHLLSYAVVFWPRHFFHCTDINGCQTLTALWNSFTAENNYKKWLDYHLQCVKTIDYSQKVGFWRRIGHWQSGAHDLVSLVCVFGLSWMLASVLELTRDDVKADLSTLLLTSSDLGDLTMASLLVDSGADVRAFDKDRQTALHVASKQEHEGVVQLLIDRGADISTIDKSGWTPLHHASMHGRTEVARLLIDRGADVSAIDKSGWTPLHHASMHGRTKVIRLLIHRGASISTTDANGTTPLHYASMNGHNEAVKSLLIHFLIRTCMEA